MGKNKLINKTIALLLTSFCGCTATSCEINSSLDYSFDDELPYFNKDGDTIGKSVNTSLTMGQYVNVLSAVELTNILKTKQPVFLYLYQDNCTHCKAFKESIQTFMIDTLIEVFSLDQSSLSSQVQILRTQSELLDELFNEIKTPRIYFLYNLEEGEIITLPSNRNDPNAFYSFMRPLINISNIYDFTYYEKFETLLGDLDEALVYYDDGSDESTSFYMDNIYELAKSSKKTTIRVKLDEENDEYASFLEYMDNPNGIRVISNGEITTYDYLNDVENAVGLINSYYS